jgi:hypothetical protein
VRIVDDSAWRIPLRMSPEQATELQVGQEARVGSLESGRRPGAGGPGRRSRPTPGPAWWRWTSGSPGGAGLLRPGLRHRAVLVDARDDVVRIPRPRLRPEGVWVLNGDDRWSSGRWRWGSGARTGSRS